MSAKNIVDTYLRQAARLFARTPIIRELLDKEKDLNAVKIMTPDHLHGVIAWPP